MSTTIHVTRRTPFTKSDALREDAVLYAQVEGLGVWLSARGIETVTMSQVLAFAKGEHPDAVLERSPILYSWIWDPTTGLFRIECVDHGEVVYAAADGGDPIVIEIEISATY